MQNIQISNPDVTAEDITKTAEELGVDNFTEYFSNGYYTEISETDSQLSYSSKNDSIIESFLGKTRLLILEDPFEGLNESLKLKFGIFTKMSSHRNIVMVMEEDFISQADHHLYLANGSVQSKK